MRNTRIERNDVGTERLSEKDRDEDQGGMRGTEGMNRGGEAQRKLQAHYFQGEWQVSCFATLVIMRIMQRQICGCKKNCKCVQV